MYTWVPFYKAIAKWILPYRKRQKELCLLLKKIGVGSNMMDKTKDGEKPLEVMDPFTFFAFFQKYSSIEDRKKWLQKLNNEIKVVNEIPDGYAGIPSAMSIALRYFANEKDRKKEDMGLLWDLAEQAVSGSLQESTFSKVLAMRGIRIAKLTQGLFWLNADEFYPIDKYKDYLKTFGIKPEVKTLSDYLKVLKEIKVHIQKPYSEVSHLAYMWGSKSYWIFQGDHKYYNITEALKDNAVGSWSVKAHASKIKAGDKFILWVTGEKSGCYALGEVVSDVYEGFDEDNEIKYYAEKAKNTKAKRVKIKITHNLYDKPLRKEDFKTVKALSQLKIGNQGTNFTATEDEYNAILEIIENMTQKKYWLYAPGRNAVKWDEFYKNGIMALGWDELGDLKQYASKKEITKTLQDFDKQKRNKNHDSLANYEFRDIMAVGDIIIVKNGSKELIGYGEVVSDYYYDNKRTDYKSCRKVNWHLKGNWLVDFNLTQKTLTNYSKGKYLKKIKELLPINSIIEQDIKEKQALNHILFGPPGTGKTFNTINKAVSIANPKFNLKQERTLIKKEYERLVKEKQIVFTTFHQSMSYEDFVEGIKPIEPEKEGDPVIYRVEDGIFKKISIEASFTIAKQLEKKETGAVMDFSVLFRNFIESIEEKMFAEEAVELKTKTGSKLIVDGISQQGNVIVKHPNGSRTYTVSKSRLSKLYSAIDNIDDVSNISDTFREIIGGCNSTSYWTVLNAIKKIKKLQKVENDERKIDYDEKKQIANSLCKEDFNSSKGKPFVLIIDEINRGNVASIFGELITLIEEDKRAGMPETIELILPYSKEPFAVPANLYIIGTMNTADRSVEALDTALRRRFVFEEIAPNPDLIKEYGDLKGSGGMIENIDVVEMLKTINIRIEKLIDKDHCLGHSYFMKIKDKDGLINCFKNQVIPLLEEYFFGDFGKIGLVLGNSFICKEKDFEKGFAHFDNYNSNGIVDDLKNRPIYTYKHSDEWDFTSIYN